MSLNVEGNDCPKLCNVTDTYMIKTQPIRASTSRDWIFENSAEEIYKTKGA